MDGKERIEWKEKELEVYVREITYVDVPHRLRDVVGARTRPYRGSVAT